MKLKLKLSDSAQVVELQDDATLQEILDKVPEKIVQLRCGFPPKSVPLEDTQATLKDLGIRTGEQIAVKVESDNIPRTETTSSTGTATPAVKTTGASDTSPYVQCGQKYLKLRVMEDDNSCMFTAVAYSIMGTVNASFDLRQIISNAILNDPIEYSDAILGRPRHEYAKWITNHNSWGGAIELAILSKHFDVTIICLDIKTLQQHTFNPGMSSFIAVVYSGIHYDAVALSSTLQDGIGTDKSVFYPDIEGQQVLEGLNQLGLKLKNLNYYTDTASFSLKCNSCGARLTGEKDATKHAASTGHTDFGEYK